MSDLLAQRKDFKRRIAEQPVYQAKRVHQVSTALSSRTVRPPPNATTVVNTPVHSQSHEDASILTRVHQIVDFLKKSQRPCSVDEIKLHITEFAEGTAEFQHLSANAKVIYSRRDNTFAYRPEYDIRTPEELVEYLRKMPDRGGLEVKKLGDSYLGEVSKVVAELRRKKLVLAITDKDNKPRYIFYNHMILENDVDEELKSNWMRLAVPDEPDLGRAMQKARLKQMQVETVEVKEQKEVKKAKKSQRITKITNSHLGDFIDLTKDYVPDAK
ncbi:transcription factor TFIIE beta subunit, TFIIEB, Tfa2 [Coemansia sp. Benny D115]|nr:transcription factor TFIIE beta subunit, TFIIEB, Tfa2 [Coemansia sp. Benny D115]